MDSRNVAGRFVNYTLQDDGENLSPLEKLLRERFLSKDNKDVVYRMVQSQIDPMVTYGNVTDAMYECFERSLFLVLDTVKEMNDVFIQKFAQKRKTSLEAMSRSRDRGFVKSNIPSNFLPRPSFNLQENSNDKLLEFQFR